MEYMKIMKKWKQYNTWAVTDDICQENAMEISNEGTSQDILNKVNVRKWRLVVENHTIEKDTVPKNCIITVDEEMIG